MQSKQASPVLLLPEGPGTSDKRKHHSTPADTEERMRHLERTRVNQQRARSRRKELVNDLQKRVDDYERRGVQATQEMQQAARRVADDNARLRALLAKKGVSDAEVEEWLQSGYGITSQLAPKSQTSMPSINPPEYFRTPPSDEAPTPPAPVSISQYQIAPAQPASSTAYRANPSSGSPWDYSRPRNAEPYSPRVGQPSFTPASDSSTSPASHISSINTPSSLAERVAVCCTSGTETSCEDAALILANMQGHGDVSRSRAALGCTDDFPGCTVKNTRVLELLDQAG